MKRFRLPSEVIGTQVHFTSKTQSWASAKLMEYNFLFFLVSAASSEVICWLWQTIVFCMNTHYEVPRKDSNQHAKRASLDLSRLPVRLVSVAHQSLSEFIIALSIE